MNIRRPRKTRTSRAEALLQETSADPAAPLARLLAASSGDGHDGELIGRDQALSAFRAAVIDPPERPSMFKSLLTLKVGVAVAAVTILGGASLAAAHEGVFPGQAQGGRGHGKPSAKHKKGHDGHGNRPTAAPTPTSPTAVPSADPELTRLCRIVLAKKKRHHHARPKGHQRPKAHPSKRVHPSPRPSWTPSAKPATPPTPDLSALIKAAGGADKVKAFCKNLLAHPAPRPVPTTPPTAAPTAVPTTAPTTVPTGVPTTAPTGRPGKFPTARPEDDHGKPRPEGR
ncbi:hypothetical protein [Actinocorallia longicatena]|uniref:Uncharacterized protein n=1 Tax=Actinocorallia longicatena TaxID=111803 RepID=A0ABP6QRU1_9ACTN